MRRSFLLLLLLLGFNSLGIAGITGKVEGVVSDIQTGAPLVGVNVILQGTSLGAASDQSGYYVILNVPAGRYSVKAIMIGYREVTVNDVRVSIDLTTKLNFQLGTETLKASESVVVVAERPLLRRDEFTSRTTVSAEDIDLQPIDNFQDIARNQAGVVGSHFRGGRSGEVLVLIDGIPVRDPAGEYSGQLGGFTSDIPESGIQEMEVTLGG
ncbi:MAG TPA: TonB-dependent receptor, partial [Candidatus Marinimicrobia bacterium]|nr:TonB-dependent receptor [Candidatus Neomarinimicrobiota bacterium]